MTPEHANALREAKFECYLAAASVDAMYVMLVDLGRSSEIHPILRERLATMRERFVELDKVRERYAMDGARAEYDAHTWEVPK